MKKGNVLTRMEDKIEAKYRKRFLSKMDILLQMAQDAAMIAANDVFSMGPVRAVKFGAAFRDAMNDMGRMVVEDAEDDSEAVYAKAKIDERLMAIVGAENFCPWEERYR